MNAIHAGEPDGVDACIKLTNELLANLSKLKNTVVCIIPMYNVDGVLDRGTSSRANQNGPQEYGFRGNAKNLDLNRDFIKCDSKNAMVFSKLFSEWQPDIFVDTHVSDGADYQYVMTLIATQHNKLQPDMAAFIDNLMLPDLYLNMAKHNYPMTPYVESRGRTPDTGLEGFLETPRFSTGYTTLFNTIGFVSESHMWKPYQDRVLATYYFLKSVIDFTEKETLQLGIARKRATEAQMAAFQFPLQWELETTKTSNFNFKGYEAKYKKSNISGLERLY
jgi:hypothetical protein